MQRFRIIVNRGSAAPSTIYKHKLGGYPTNISTANRPICGNCGSPLLLLLQLDCSDPQLKSYGFSIPFLYIYDCEGCGTTYEPMFYTITADRVVILAQGESNGWDLQRQLVPEFPLHLEPISKEQAQEIRSHYRRDSGFGKCHLMGCTPLWVQRSGRPDCIKCGKKMKSIIQLDSDMGDGPRNPLLMFGDCGAFYVHRCIDCSIFAAIKQGC